MANKQLNDLLGYGDLKIYQMKDSFCFSIDSVLLANFISIGKKSKKIIDLGTGNAVIPLILAYKYFNVSIVGIEIQKKIYDLAFESIEYNRLSSKIKVLNEDINNLSKIYPKDSFDIVVSNPPYFKYEKRSLTNESITKTIARHEIKVTFEEIVKAAVWLLKENGTFAFVHRPDRLFEFLDILKKYRLEPKKIQFVYPKMGKECNAILVECIKNGNSGLKIISPLYVHDRDGYTDEILNMFNRK